MLTTQELVEKYKGKGQEALFGLLEVYFPQFLDYSESIEKGFKLKSSEDDLSYVLEGMIASDEDIDDDELAFLSMIYQRFFPNITMNSYDSIRATYQNDDDYERILDLLNSFLEHVEGFASNNEERLDTIKETYQAVFFAVFYSNGFLDSRQKEVLKRIENFTAKPKVLTVDDIPDLINMYKNKSQDELVSIVVENVLEIDKAHQPYVAQYENFDNFSPNKVMDTVLIPFLAIDGELDDKEYAFISKCHASIKPDKPLLDFVALNEKVVRFTESYTESVTHIIDGGKLMNQLYPGLINNFLHMILGCFAANGVFDSSQKTMLRKLLTPDEYSSSGESSSTEATGSSVSHTTASSGVTSDKQEQVYVVDFGATIVDNDDDYVLSFGAFIKNPNPLHVANDVTIKVIVKDENGRAIESKNYSVHHIDPNSEFSFGEEISIYHGVPSDIQVVVSAESFAYVANGQQNYNGIKVGSYSYSEASWRGYDLTGEITNNYTVKLSSAQIYLVFSDENKKIQGGYNFYVNDLFPGVTEAFNEYVYLNLNNASYINSSIDFYNSSGNKPIVVNINVGSQN